MPLKRVNWVTQKPQADHKPMAGWVWLSPQSEGMKAGPAALDLRFSSGRTASIALSCTLALRNRKGAERW